MFFDKAVFLSMEEADKSVYSKAMKTKQSCKSYNGRYSYVLF